MRNQQQVTYSITTFCTANYYFAEKVFGLFLFAVNDRQLYSQLYPRETPFFVDVIFSS